MNSCIRIQNLHLRYDLASSMEDALGRIEEVASAFGLAARRETAPLSPAPERGGWGPFTVSGLISGDRAVLYEDVLQRLPAWARREVCVHTRDEHGRLAPLDDDFIHNAPSVFTDLSPEPKFFEDMRSSNIATSLEVGWLVREGGLVPEFLLIAFGKGLNIELDVQDLLAQLSVFAKVGSDLNGVAPPDYASYTTRETVVRALSHLQRPGAFMPPDEDLH